MLRILEKSNILRELLPFLLSVLSSVYPLLFLYNQNAQYVMLFHVLLVCVFTIIVASMLYFVIKKWFGSSDITAVYCMLFWIFFFSYQRIYYVVINYNIRHRILLSSIIFIMLLCFILFKKKIDTKQQTIIELTVKSLSIVYSFLIIFNLCLAVINHYSLMDKEEVVFKADFAIDDDVFSPNVYWIHCDGMLGFDAMERYFDDPQEDFSNYLSESGFMINYDAQFEAFHITQYAIPALMNPNYYDEILGEYINEGKQEVYSRLSKGEKNNKLYDQLLKARMNNELVLAFNNNKQYTTYTIANHDIYFFPTTDYFYDFDRIDAPLRTSGNSYMFNEFSSIQSLEMLLRETSVFIFAPVKLRLQIENLFIPHSPIVKQVEIIDNKLYVKMPEQYQTIYNSLEDIYMRQTNNPRFVLISFFLAHSPFVYLADGEKNPEPNNILAYAEHHKYTSSILQLYIQQIIENDPDAVIILQGDHGLHTFSQEEIMRNFDGREESVSDIWNSGISAVRIPEKYGGLSEPLHPLNITRYLINNYVGKNYEYLE